MSLSKTPAPRSPLRIGSSGQSGLSLLQLLGILILVGIVLAVILKQWA